MGTTLPRVSNNDVSISTCVLPKNTVILLSIYTMQRVRQIWKKWKFRKWFDLILFQRTDIWGDDAHEFNPDHFLPENVQKRHPFAFIPFSGGPRNCIGYQYGMISLKVMLASILRRFTFSSDLKMSELKVKFEIILRLESDFMVKIEKRDWPAPNVKSV